jgi:hypothetical protein
MRVRHANKSVAQERGVVPEFPELVSGQPFVTFARGVSDVRSESDTTTYIYIYYPFYICIYIYILYKQNLDTGRLVENPISPCGVSPPPGSSLEAIIMGFLFFLLLLMFWDSFWGSILNAFLWFFHSIFAHVFGAASFSAFSLNSAPSIFEMVLLTLVKLIVA